MPALGPVCVVHTRFTGIKSAQSGVSEDGFTGLLGQYWSIKPSLGKKYFWTAPRFPLRVDLCLLPR